MAQFLGFYQLENLHRAQTKFLLVAIVDATSSLPAHVLLKPDLVIDANDALAKIQVHITQQGLPAWWPIVLISQSGSGETEVVKTLEAQGQMNVFSYRGGWESLIAGT